MQQQCTKMQKKLKIKKSDLSKINLM